MKFETRLNICASLFISYILMGLCIFVIMLAFDNETQMNSELYNSKYLCKILEMEPDCIDQKIRYFVNIKEIERNISAAIEYNDNCEAKTLKYIKEQQFDCYYYNGELYDAIYINVVNFNWWQHPAIICGYIITIIIIIIMIFLARDWYRENNPSKTKSDLESLINSKVNELKSEINTLKNLMSAYNTTPYIKSTTNDIKDLINVKASEMINLIKESTTFPTAPPLYPENNKI
jgi:hypothetical protein